MVGVDGICRERPYRIMILLEIASRLQVGVWSLQAPGASRSVPGVHNLRRVTYVEPVFLAAHREEDGRTVQSCSRHTGDRDMSDI